VAVALALVGVVSTARAEDHVWVATRDGSLLYVVPNQPTIDWQRIRNDGTTQTYEMQLIDIPLLQLSLQPQGEQLSHIRQLIEGLGDRDYHVRMQAESELTEIGAPYVPLISLALESPSLEVQYRADRILRELRKVRRSPTSVLTPECDQVRQASGSVLEGEVLQNEFAFQWRGSEVRLTRESLAQISLQPITQQAWLANGTPLALTPQANEAGEYVESRTIHVAEDEFYDKNRHQLVSFETDKYKRSILRHQVIDETFVFAGARFHCVSPPGEVVNPGLALKTSQTKGNSAANRIPQANQQMKMFQGVMEIRFCLPDLANVPATIHEIGMFMAGTQPRHQVIEAYNGEGHLVTTTEVDQKSESFVGLKTTEPIAAVRVRANPAPNIGGVRPDFAIDDVDFDFPRSAALIATPTHWAVTLRDGQRLVARKLEIDADNVTVEMEIGMTASIPLAEVAAIAAPSAGNAGPTAGGAMLMLPDRSVVRVADLAILDTDGAIAIQDFPNAAIAWSDVVGLWSLESPSAEPNDEDEEKPTGEAIEPVVRYPMPSDFQHGAVAVVSPGRRLMTTELSIAGGQVAVALDGAVELAGDLPAAEVVDDQPQLVGTLNNVGCVWWKPVPTLRDELGLVRTHDGRQFVLGGSSGFRLAGLSSDGATIVRGEERCVIPLDEIAAIRFAL